MDLYTIDTGHEIVRGSTFAKTLEQLVTRRLLAQQNIRVGMAVDTRLDGRCRMPARSSGAIASARHVWPWKARRSPGLGGAYSGRMSCTWRGSSSVFALRLPLNKPARAGRCSLGATKQIRDSRIHNAPSPSLARKGRGSQS
jgi:hypothetical protein